MKAIIIYVVIFHHDNGTSFLNGVFNELSELTKFVSGQGLTGMDTIALHRRLIEQHYDTISTPLGEFVVLSCEQNRSVNLSIN